MSAPASATSFLELAVKAGVLDQRIAQEHGQAFEQNGHGRLTPRQMAEILVRDGLLTAFQAENLLAGKWRGFLVAGKYRLLHRLGAGGMGCVYLCEHLFMHRRVALKVLPTAYSQDPDSVERFYHEARAVARLDHPNIVRAHDIDREDKLHFLVLEYVEGVNLHDLVQKHGPLSLARAANYIRQAALGLQHAHEAGLVHRDIKPGNLLIDRQGIVKILDMGLARFFDDERDFVPQPESGHVLGTADYLAPEQVLDSRVDIRADIYSLGLSFYYLLAGRSPFQDGTTSQKLIWHQVRLPKPIRSLRSEVPEELAAVIGKMIAKEPSLRHQTPLEVAAALTPWTQEQVPPPSAEELPLLPLTFRDGAAGPGSPGPPVSRDTLSPVGSRPGAPKIQVGQAPAPRNGQAAAEIRNSKSETRNQYE
jgi:serine/threonine protein kinase